MDHLIPGTNSLVLECTSYYFTQTVSFLGQDTNVSSDIEYTSGQWPDHR